MSEVRVLDVIESLASATVNAAFMVYRALGPGLLESAYADCLAIELAHAGLKIEREQIVPLTYQGHLISKAYRLDLIVNGLLLGPGHNLPAAAKTSARSADQFQRSFSQRWNHEGAKPRRPNPVSAPSAPILAPSRLRA